MPALLSDRAFLLVCDQRTSLGVVKAGRSEAVCPVVRIVSQVADAEEAALLSRQAALKLGCDATQALDRGAAIGGGGAATPISLTRPR